MYQKVGRRDKVITDRLYRYGLTVRPICRTLAGDGRQPRKGGSLGLNRLFLVSFTPGSTKTLHNKRRYPREAAGLQLKIIRSALSAHTAFAFLAPEFILYVYFGAKTLWKAKSCGLAAGATQIKDYNDLGCWWDSELVN